MMVRHFMLLLAVAALCIAGAGCPKQGQDPRDPGGKGPDASTGNEGGKAKKVRTERKAITFASCERELCNLHPGSGRYHLCLSSGGGRCFQYGAVCEPTDACMWDATAQSYRKCNRPMAGACAEFAGPCTPSGQCMLEVATGVLRKCEQAQSGKCLRFGAPCEQATGPESRETTSGSGT